MFRSQIMDKVKVDCQSEKEAYFKTEDVSKISYIELILNNKKSIGVSI